MLCVLQWWDVLFLEGYAFFIKNACLPNIHFFLACHFLLRYYPNNTFHTFLPSWEQCMKYKTWSYTVYVLYRAMESQNKFFCKVVFKRSKIKEK